jgi:hypothetical protein
MSNSTNAGSFSSYDQNLSAGVDETPSFDRAFSGQQILGVDHGSFGDSQISQDAPNSIPMATGAQIHPTPPFYLDSGPHPERYIIQSPRSIDPDPLLDSGPQGASAGMYHSAFLDAE